MAPAGGATSQVPGVPIAAADDDPSCSEGREAEAGIFRGIRIACAAAAAAAVAAK